MDFFNLGSVSWEHSQLLYHAAAYLRHECLITLLPATPYVCIGFHQDAAQEIDLDFARNKHIPVFRREVGGGAVYLDGGQLFFQLILDPKREGVPQQKAEFYRKFLVPIIDTYRAFGVKAEYKPVNDIIANGRKVSGTGAAEINGMMVLVGNFILDFNYEMMSKLLRVPDEKFRDKVFKTLNENLSTFKKETGSIPDAKLVAEDVSHRFDTLLGPFNRKDKIDPEIEKKADDLGKTMLTDDWLLQNDKDHREMRPVKIRDGVYVIQTMLKTPGGLVRVSAVNQDGILQDIHISGDFFFYPAEQLKHLEQVLDGVQATEEQINDRVDIFYKLNKIESPGLLPGAFGRIFSAVITN